MADGRNGARTQTHHSFAPLANADKPSRERGDVETPTLDISGLLRHGRDVPSRPKQKGQKRGQRAPPRCRTVHRLGVDGFADRMGVDRKTVERWIAGRVPYRRHQYALAAALGLDVVYLWPGGQRESEIAAMGQAEVLALYPHRSLAPPTLWCETFAQAETQIDVLVYAGFWLSEDPAFHRLLSDKAEAGVAIRILLGDPDSEEVVRRSVDEGIGEATIPGKIRNAIVNYRDLMGLPGLEFRLHRSVLYNSIYRADDHMLVNPHVFGASAYMAPMLHLRRLPGADMFAMYLDSFKSVWSSSTPLDLSVTQVA